MALIRRGLAAQNADDLAQADDCYRQALAIDPEQADAWQLRGALTRRRGESELAERCFRRSLAAHPAQPQVWNSLGNLVDKLGRSSEALVCFDQALALVPTHADASYNRARVLHALSRCPEAYAALSAIWLAGQPVGAAVLQLKAQIESDSGRLELALETLDAALLQAPDRAALHHNRAVVLHRGHRFLEALEGHQQALRLGLRSADAQYNLGNSLQCLGRGEQAISAYQSALSLQPEHALALYDLARLRWRLGHADFDTELLQLSHDRADSAVAPGIHAQLLWRAERYEDAAAAFALASQRAPATAAFTDGLGRCKVRLGEMEAGLALQRQAVDRAPLDPELRTNHATSLLIARRPAEALKEAQTAYALAPLNQSALALMGLAWRALSDPLESWLNDGARFVQVCDLEPPEGWSDMAQFNAALADELRALHADREAPIDQTLRQGTQTLGDIFEQGHPLVNALKVRIAQAVDGYIASLPQDDTHPFLRRVSGAWRFADSWSSRLRTRGFHTAHVHPHGWISSAYYVAVPGSCADPQRREGWLQFGQPDFDMGMGDMVRRCEAPQVGRLVLFPSMMWHGTSPFSQDSERLSIAFDVQPR